MENFLIYIAKSALAAGAFYLLYLALFQHQKQFVFNRIYLPVSLALSFIIPLITFTSVRYIHLPTAPVETNSFAYLAESTVTQPVAPAFEMEWFHYLMAIYAFGILAFLCYLVLGHFKAFSIIKKSRLQKLFNVNVNVTNKDVHPFSFFDKIVLSDRTLDNPNLGMIILHEEIHVREKHTLDILFVEILFLLQWFNPFAWLLKDAIKNNLEYKTDHQVVKTIDPQQYQLAMVGLAHKEGIAPFLTALNGSQLKNRIVMMKKKTRNKYALLKQLLVLPLLAVLTMSLANKEVKTEFVEPATKADIVGEAEVSNSSISENLRHVSLEGVITDQYTREPLVGAVVSLENTSENTRSNNKGEYQMEFEMGKPVVLTFSANGYYSDKIAYYGNEELNVVLTPIEEEEGEEIIVTGKVTDHNGTPLPGTAVIVKGSTNGTLADMAGNYKIETDRLATLIFSMVGYINKEVSVNGDTEINIELEKDDKLQDGKRIIDVAAKGENTSEDVEYERKINFDTGEIITIEKSTGKIVEKTAPKGESGVLQINEVGGKTVANYKNRTYEHFVKGKITDKEGNPIPNVFVFVLNKTIGTVSDANGNYILGLNDTDVTLAIWANGYKGQEIKVNGENVVDIELVEYAGSKVETSGDQKKDLKPFEKNSVRISDDKQPLYVVDGEILSTIEELNPENFESVDVLKKNSATAIYGESGKNGAMLITTKAASNKKPVKPFEKNSVRISDNKEPLYIVDGKPVADINKLDPDDIESMTVLKGAEATALYGTVGGKNGVIQVRTKPGAQFESSPKIEVHEDKKLGDKNPLIILDGEKYKGDIQDFDYGDISSATIIKNESVTQFYGDEAKDGVIIIYTHSYKISSIQDLRKFIAQKIRYPLEAQERNQTGEVKVSVRVESDGRVTVLSDEDTKDDAIGLDEVVVVAYAPKSLKVGETDITNDVLKKEVKRVAYMMPAIDIPELMDKDVIVRVKFDLQ